MEEVLSERIKSHYSDLSDQMKAAADFVLENPFEIATRSMRSVANEAQISPSTFTRFARAVGVKDYEKLKLYCLEELNDNQSFGFKEKAIHLQNKAIEQDGKAGLLLDQVNACIENTKHLVEASNIHKLNEIVDMLETSQRVIVVGALASMGFAQYMAYVGAYCHENWHLLDSQIIGSGIGFHNITKDDTLFVITKYPNADRVIRSVRFAKDVGAKVIVLTDTHKCSALPMADLDLIVPTESPQFFSSYAATAIVIETIIGMLVARGGDKVQERIEFVEKTNHQIGEYWFDK